MTEGSAIASLSQLRGFPKERPAWHAEIVQREMNGGKTPAAALDVLGDRLEVKALTVSGLVQKSFEHLVNRFGAQLSALHLWKCPRIEDFAALESMPQLTHVAIFWNQRASCLWDMRKTPTLRGLRFEDFTKLDSLSDLASAASLVELHFGDANWSKMNVQSLEPLGALASLRELSFNPKAVLDQRVQPLAMLQQIKDLSFSTRLFTTEQIAWLRARLPAALPSESLQPYRTLRQPLQLRGKRMDVLVNGKGKPFLSSDLDKDKLDRYTAQFMALFERFRDDPALEPRG